MLAFGKRYLAQKNYISNHSDEALKQLAESTFYFERLENPAQISINTLLHSLWTCSKENVHLLPALLEREAGQLKAIKPGEAILEIGQSIIGALERETGAYEKAENALLSSLKRSNAQGMEQVACGTLVHLVKLYLDKGEMQKAEKAVEQAFHIASENKYHTFWDMHLPTLTAVSSFAAQRNIQRKNALELLSLYPEKPEHSNICLRICMLGQFNMEFNGIAITINSWKKRKAESILKYLLLNKDHFVHRKTLAELFWPEMDAISALMNLRNVVYEMKRVLSDHGFTNKSEDSLIINQGGGLAINAGRISYLDTDELRALYNQWKSLPPDTPPSKQKIDALERIAAIYKGNFLEEDIYEDWTSFEREKLKAIWLESLFSLSGIYESRQENLKKERLLLQILTFDPFNEEACASLLKLYLRTNQRSRAVLLYEGFAERMKKECDMSLDGNISSLLEKA